MFRRAPTLFGTRLSATYRRDVRPSAAAATISRARRERVGFEKTISATAAGTSVLSRLIADTSDRRVTKRASETVTQKCTYIIHSYIAESVVLGGGGRDRNLNKKNRSRNRNLNNLKKKKKN